MSDNEIEVHAIMPHGAMGAGPDDDELESMLRKIAVTAGDKNEWPEKYGTDFENAVFMMHRYCWCEKPDCAWCGPDCECEIEYRLDGAIVTEDEYLAYMLDDDSPSWGDPDYDKWWDDQRARRKQTLIKECAYCAGTSYSAEKGALPRTYAPNFWHKPSGLRVWWYKYIGRGMEVRVGEGQTMPTDLEAIRRECLDSVPPVT